MSTKNLSLLEHWILLAIGHCEPQAYGISIHGEIKRRTGHDYPLGSIYSALWRLSGNGSIRSYDGEPLNSRGGRRKTLFVMTEAGRKALADIVEATRAMTHA
ncbi:MAG: PadR family transcriptional regulator [Rhodoblastus sp.]|nr:PadR family transcriptional regulator [Rhodoblastus sp.]